MQRIESLWVHKRLGCAVTAGGRTKAPNQQWAQLLGSPEVAPQSSSHLEFPQCRIDRASLKDSDLQHTIPGVEHC